MTATLICVLFYGFIYTISEQLSGSINSPHTITVVVISIFLFVILFIQRKRGTFQKYRVCAPLSAQKSIVLSVPLLAVVILNLFLSFKSNICIFSITEILLVFISAFAEEFLFRGILPSKLSELYNLKGLPCAIVVNILFALAHIGMGFFGIANASIIIQIIFAFCIGLCFSGLAIRTGSIVPGLVIHFLINISSLCNVSKPVELPKSQFILWIIISALCSLYGILLISNGTKEAT